jgi:iron-sulfur cluster repair protein YtfE (RIC family)
MIRHDAIAELSRDHHQALMQAMRLKRATDDDAASVVAEFVEFFDTEAQRHFELEEQVLVPGYLRMVGVEHAVDPVIVQVLREHAELRALVETVRRGGAAAPLVREIGQRLDAHVRLEERKLFPRIQAGLTEQQLAELARAMADAERR